MWKILMGWVASTKTATTAWFRKHRKILISFGVYTLALSCLFATCECRRDQDSQRRYDAAVQLYHDDNVKLSGDVKALRGELATSQSDLAKAEDFRKRVRDYINRGIAINGRLGEGTDTIIGLIDQCIEFNDYITRGLEQAQ